MYVSTYKIMLSEKRRIEVISNNFPSSIYYVSFYHFMWQKKDLNWKVTNSKGRFRNIIYKIFYYDTTIVEVDHKKVILNTIYLGVRLFTWPRGIYICT